MAIIKEILTLAYVCEYESAYDLSQQKKFSNPKIFTAKGDLSKRWYVYFSYRNPKTGKLKRVTPIYGEANRYKTKEERLFVLTKYQKVLLKLLKEGFNPFEDNSALIEQRKAKQEDLQNETKKTNPKKEETESEATKMTIKEAFDYGLKLKEKLLSKTTKRAYENRLKNFLLWLETDKPDLKTIDQLDGRVVTEFLNSVLTNTSARNRNNYRVDLSSLVQVLVDNYIISQNYVKKIPVLKTIPQRNKTYTAEKQEEIYSYLEKEDPSLLLFIKFISYNFLRPIEVCRLKVEDVDLNNKTVRFLAKSGVVKTKIIPDLLIQDLPDLSHLDKKLDVFTPDGIGGNWDIDEDNKRDYFTKRFKRVVKDHFKLGTDYGLYSFRHTFITKLYRALVKASSPFEAKSRLMLITGHSSMAALEKYLRDIDAELPADYSALLK
ncbi:tyrosine-type recombinase/integrase [Aestuariibaculum suncheonense]|uniref:Site-specific integrase n=1 Tax=Aestuariibaculum suncheonense TaxID=1028745 RepID=A0A8J6Q978_9FLAO|nr:site-specific integrase [Aestuariibaculum suncheonense]MBD0836107.1 site-specific integrase [Aestuariibaculum suncheonense]